MEQNNVTAQLSEKQEDVRTAIEDISIIKRIIDRSELNMQRLGWLFLSFGGVTLGFSVLRMIIMVILSRTMSVSAVSNVSIISSCLSFIIALCLFVFFIRMRRQMVSTESKYTMKLYDLWGVVLFVPVVLGLAPFLISVIGSYFGASEYTALIYSLVLSIMKYAAVCMAIFFTGHYTDSLFMKILSVVLIILLPVVCAFGIPFFDGMTVADIQNGMNLYAYFSTKISFVSFVLNIIYVIMGIVFVIKQRSGSDGNA